MNLRRILRVSADRYQPAPDAYELDTDFQEEVAPSSPGGPGEEPELELTWVAHPFIGMVPFWQQTEPRSSPEGSR